MDRSGIAVVVGTFFAAFVKGTLLFAAGGTLALLRAWFFLALSFVAMFGQIALVARKNPELVNHRDPLPPPSRHLVIVARSQATAS